MSDDHLIDKGGYLHDPATGQNYAKGENNDFRKKKKKRNMIRPADNDVLFAMFLEYKRGKISQRDIADITGFAPPTLCNHFKKMDFHAKADAFLGKIGKMKTSDISVESIIDIVAKKVADGSVQHDDAVEDLMTNARQHFRKMKGSAIIKQAKSIKAVVDIGREHYGKDTKKEQEQATSGPVLNLNFLMTETMRPVNVTAT